MYVARLPLFNDVWVQVRDGDAGCLLLFNRHYSKYHYVDGRKPNRFVGPGERIVLITQCGKAMFVWRKFIDASGQKGVNCSVFRNESEEHLSSDLIKEAVRIAWERWPGERLYTYVNAKQIRSTNPGYCYKKAGWKFCGITKKRKYLIFELLPNSSMEEHRPDKAKTKGSIPL